MKKTIATQSPEETQRLGYDLGSLIANFLVAHPAPDDASITVALSGELGAGKTTFTQGIAAGLGVSEQVTSPTFTLVNEYTIYASAENSDGQPNQVTIEPPITFIHIDSYRLAGDEGQSSAPTKSESVQTGEANNGTAQIHAVQIQAEQIQVEQKVTVDDAATFGIEEFFEIPRSLVVIEWAERIKSLLPPERLQITLAYGADATNDGDFPEPSSERAIQIMAYGSTGHGILTALADQITADG